ncbi:MAG: hypothetical protein OES99_03845, partial [Gammaproteobacteria bacterium]|nr:hypothetical protein [Gammaproteobacteria bacterium]
MTLRHSKAYLPAVIALGAILVTATAHAPSASGVSNLNIASSSPGGSGPAISVTSTGTITPVIPISTPHAQPELRLISVIETF